jgi:raffinose/stachyose/melibiose transport system permease protein
MKSQLKNVDWDAYLLVGPVLLIFGLAVVYPLIDTVRFSFYAWRGLGPMKPAGWSNYVNLFTDPNFLNSLRITITWTLATTILSVSVGWIVALLSGLVPGRSTPFRLAIFAAYGISAVVSGVMWQGVFQTDIGFLNGVLRAIGLESFAHAWLGDTKTALWAVITAFVWTQTGLPLLTGYASIRSIPAELFEAGYIDGASSSMIIRHIMIPLSRPGIRVAIFMNLLNSLKAFDVIFILTGGGPVRSTETIGYFMYRESVFHFKLGYGAASVVVMILGVFLIAIPLIRERSRSA